MHGPHSSGVLTITHFVHVEVVMALGFGVHGAAVVDHAVVFGAGSVVFPVVVVAIVILMLLWLFFNRFCTLLMLMLMLMLHLLEKRIRLQ